MGTTKLLKFNKWRQRKILGTLGSDGKESDCHAGDRGSIPGLGRSPGGAHGNPLHFSCLENPTDRGAWRATVHGFAESDMTERSTRLALRQLYFYPQKKPEDVSYTEARNEIQKRETDSPQAREEHSMRFLHQSCPHCWLLHNEMALVPGKAGGRR